MITRVCNLGYNHYGNHWFDYIERIFFNESKGVVENCCGKVPQVMSIG